MFRRLVYGDLKGLKRSLRRKMGRAIRRHGKGWRVYVRSGFRTRAEQQELWNHYQRYGWPIAAYPGTSRHESGRAADISLVSPKGAMLTPGPRWRAAARAEGLTSPVRGEPWHVEEA